ncbi:efflux RND transporter permease subunit [Sinomicrobium weinanense]|uniref:Efflux RND transporter permease subunit n=1 Tax=Sinomicrobium weinanense TaxID=2842200 RepID=A0A926JP61_9FLAO|nr:efflux RND transporter permease subunit [Sinomicrobium weinanense]MBC9794908.1 efflux RND transporter permease subunit [Sinomicrobium weinanense]MBU3125679.1 efflux RND transporter permease subunit [Sinomicrobium weinanense]
MDNKKIDKEFAPSSWAINNRTIIYVVIAILFFMGLSAYYTMPRESFPEIKETKIYISSVYPGNTAEDIEKLITDPLEKELRNVSNVVEVTSTSQEDYSIITVEFDEDITVDAAKQKVKDEVDSEKANEDWPTFNGAKVEPNVFDLNFSEEVPILNVNIKGDYRVEKLKDFAEYLEDEIETLPEIKQVDIRGAQDKEVEVAVDIYKMTAAKVSFDDVINAINGGNATISGGNLIASGQRRTIRVLGEIEDPRELLNFVVKSEDGAIYLKDIAEVSFKEEDKTTYAREFGENVVMLDVKKRAGKNLIDATKGLYKIVEDTQENYLPKNVTLSITNDQSTQTLNQVDDLVNNIIFGVILVVGVLMFFLGFRNALFVGFAIPMSMLISFLIAQTVGFTMNTMVLFALVMGLGMLVDNGIVLVENVYRLMEEEGLNRIEAAKKGIGEIALPIIVSTATTVAAFIPLGMWPGVMGEFMIYFPMTLSIVLGSSLFVAIFMNSMLVSNFMEIKNRVLSRKELIRLSIVLGGLGILLIFVKGPMRGIGTLMIVAAAMFWIYKYFIKKLANRFQRIFLTWLEDKYKTFLSFALRRWHPYAFVGGTILMLFFSFVLVGIAGPKVEFFPDNKPNQIIVYIEYPQGTDIDKTNAMTKKIEQDVYSVLNAPKFIDNGYNYMVESAVSQVGEGAGNPETDGGSSAEMPHKGKITVTLREFKYRRGQDSEELRKDVQAKLAGKYPGVSISVEKDAVGPPAGYPINIEIKGEDYAELVHTAERMRDFINEKSISGIEELKIDVNRNKPTMEVTVDREKAGELGVSAGQVGTQMRRALFGEKAGVYKKAGEDYDINVRFNEENRYNTSALFNQKVTFRDAASGQLKEIPIAAVVTQRNTASFSAIKHRNLKRLVTVYSAVLPGYNANEIVTQLKSELKNFKITDRDTSFVFTGEMEEQEKNMTFLMGALFSGLGLIMLLLIFQFGSISKPTIIMLAIFLSFIGVLFGLVIFNMTFVIIMTMMGIISLAGIVVNNGVVLLDYNQILIDRKKHELNLPENSMLQKKDLVETIVNAGKARLRPVILTAITTVLGLIPLAIGLNIDFFSLFANWDPKIYLGGDNVIFWGPLAWTVIFGLTFATFLTLIIVPVTFYLVSLLKMRLLGKNKNKDQKGDNDIAESDPDPVLS